MNINELKKQLQNLGVSTSTPGLVGEERFEELSFRLDSSQKVNTGKAEKTVQGTAESSDAFVVPSLSHLSIGEIRSRLTALGESTATPGLTGEERRTALMRRLIDAVCVNDDDSNIGSIASTIVAETLKPTPVPVKVTTPIEVDPTPVSPVAQPTAPPVQAPAEPPSPEVEVSAAVTAAAISALKNDLKRLVNQRAMAVASKLSGSQQDEQLKVCEARLARIEAEATQFKALLQKGETKLPAESIQSEFLVLNPGAASFAIDALISRLDGYRSSTKDKIREHRLRIREEGDDHPQYGVAAEEKLKIQLSEANLASAKSGKVVVSRARQKLSEVKDIETQLQQEGRVASVPDSPTKPTVPFKVDPSAAPVGGTSSKGLGSSPKDKPPVHNLSNKIQTGVAPRATLPVSPEAPQPKTADKWSTEIAPNLGAPNRVEKPTKVDILASKLPNFTSSFLGKAIDLDSGALSSKSEDRSSSKKSPGVEVVKPVPLTVPADNTPSVKASAPVAPASVPLSSLPSNEAGPVSSTPAGPGPVGSVKLSTAPVPVIPGRRPPPRPEGSVSQNPPGVDMTHPQQGAFAQSAPTPSLAAKEEEEAAFDFHASEFDEDHDEYFREVSEAASRKTAPSLQASTSASASAEEKEVKEVHRISTEDEDARKSPLVRRADKNFSASNDSEPDETHDSAAAYVPEDGDDLDNDSDDYDRLYGTRRMDVGEEDDDDLEELPGSRSSRTPMRTHSNSSFGDGNRLDPLPEVPQDSRSASGSRSNSRNGSRSGSRGESRQHEPRADSISPDAHQGPPVAPHLPPIEESDFTPPSTKTTQRKSFVLRDPHNSPRLDAKLNQSAPSLENSGDLDYTPPPTAHKTKKPIYDLGGNLAPNDDDGDGLEAFEEIGNGEEDEEDRLGDEKIQIRILRSHAKVLEGLNDTAAAEAVHLRALELDPMNISTLEGFALFLHQKKGELARAEAFFNRGLQVCLPGLMLKTSATNTPQSGKKSVSQMSFTTDGTMQGSKVKHIVKFILSYAHFLSKAKGDLEAASILYKKGIDLAPDNAFLLATYAHFLAQVGDGESNAAASEYFQRALKISPGSGQYAMWYGKLLKKTGKIGQAELMYKVALEQSKGNETMEATAMCNYATFVFKQRRDPERANVLFKAGLGSYPEHKGLRKNYAVLVKAHPQFASDGLAPAPAKKDRKSAADRAQLLAQNALNRLSQSKLLDTTAEGDAESDRGDDT